MTAKSTSVEGGKRVVVVTDDEQLIDAFSIRAIVYLGEVGLSEGQVFDGNDKNSSQILMYDGDLPIGSGRIRWFADFAKIEKTAFLAEHRNTRNLSVYGRFLFSHVAKKGYTKLLTYAEAKYARLWQKLYGFEFVEGRPPLVVPGHETCFEMIKTLVPPEDAITLGSPPAMLFRIEGDWETPTALE